MTDICSSCGVFDDRCTCSTLEAVQGFPSSATASGAPDLVSGADPAPSPGVGSNIAGDDLPSSSPGEGGSVLPSGTGPPTFSQMAHAVQWCALMAASHVDPEHLHVELALHAANVLLGMEAGQL